MAVSFYETSLSLGRHIGDIYPDDTTLLLLKNGLYAAKEEICEISDEARQRCARIATLEVARTVEQVIPDDIDEMINVAEPEAVEGLKVVLREDGEALKSDERRPKWVIARFLSYMTTIGEYLDNTKKGEGRVAYLVKKLDQLWGLLKRGDDHDRWG